MESGLVSLGTIGPVLFVCYFLPLFLVAFKVVRVPTVFFAKKGGDELDGEFGSLALNVLERVIFDDVYTDDVAFLADVVGDGGDFAVGKTFFVRHAGPGGVQRVDGVEVETDPDVIDL